MNIRIFYSISSLNYLLICLFFQTFFIICSTSLQYLLYLIKYNQFICIIQRWKKSYFNPSPGYFGSRGSFMTPG